MKNVNNVSRSGGVAGATRGSKFTAVRTFRWIFRTESERAAFGQDIISITPTDFASNELLTERSSKLTPCSKNYNKNYNYTDRINGWIYANDLVHETTTQRQSMCNTRRVWEYTRKLSTPEGSVIGYGLSNSIKNAKQLCDYVIWEEYVNKVRVQMDRESPKESVQGLADQQSEQSENTIITRDEAQTVSDLQTEIKAIEYCSTEKVVQVPSLTERWMPLKALNIQTSQILGTTVKSYYLPETLYSEMQSSPNLVPFETFIYGKYDITMKFVTNANKFQCGKVIVSAKFDSYQADEMQSSIQAALSRPHIVLDLATNVEGELTIPFRYHRTFLRNVRNSSASVGVRPAKYATVMVQILSPLRTGVGGSTDMYIRPFVKINNAHFAGMSYRVAVQMDTLGGVLKEALPSQELRGVLGGAEKLLKSLGTTKNRDKPTTMDVQIVVPRPRLNFGSGKGLIDSVPLRMNPYAMTSFTHVKPYNDDPKTVLDIAKIWGLQSSFVWNSSQQSGTILLNQVVDPSVRNYGKGYEGTPTPLEYITGMYNFWAGTIEMRFDFISNAFHTGAVMLSVEFGRPSPENSEDTSTELSACTYTKTFHLGDQKSVCIRIPYIYDTVWRRCNTLLYQPQLEKPETNETIKNTAIGMQAQSYTKIRMRVLNELRPVSTASQEIDVLCYWRASENFMVHSLKQHSCYLQSKATKPAMDRFPSHGYRSTIPTQTDRRKRSAIEETEFEKAAREKELYHSIPNDMANMWNERVIVQMDNGEKENEDETENFNVGNFNLGVQTNDSQFSIKDILRRPVLLCSNVKVKGALGGTNHGFFIPLMPPSREFVGSDQQDWSNIIGQTPQAGLMNLFRFWRGTMRYTIIVHGDYNHPIYITHLPHSGVRLIGNTMLSMDSNTAQSHPLYGCGLTTEILIPSVNPTGVFETPYETENDWTLTFEEDAQRNYSWRDKGDTNAGHIVISTVSNVTVTVWWSAGDDFEVANFYGIPACSMDDHLYMWEDKHARVQMDFQSVDKSDVSRFVKETASLAVPFALSCIPGVGQACAMTYGYKKSQSVFKKIDTALGSVNECVNSAKGFTENLKNITEDYSSLLTDLQSQIRGVVDKIAGTFSLVASVKTIIEHAFFDIVTAWIDQSWTAVGMGIMRAIYQVLGGAVDIFGYAVKITNVIKTYFGLSAEVQAESDKTLVGILCALVGSVMGCAINSRDFEPFHIRFMKIFTTTSGISYINQVLRFVTTTFEAIKEMVLKALGLVDPEIAALKSLCTNSELINEFVTNAQICLNEANSSLMLAPSFRLKFWHTTLRAYQIQKAIVTASRNIVTPHLTKMCQDVIKTATERFVDLSCSPVRYEPYVICISGPPGIGKSFMTEKFAAMMLKNIEFNKPTAGITYTRAVGSKYWSAYRDQPCIIYDDWLNLNSSESIEQQISELYQLKTTTRFIPEMAHLEEKRISANPLVVFLVCNNAFPSQMSNVAIHTDAVYRRRDLVIDVRLKQEWRGKDLRSTLTGTDSAELTHLEFSMYKDSKKSDSKCKQYKDFATFAPWFLKKHLRYHRQEQINVRRRLDDLGSNLQLAEGEMMSDPFELLYTVQDRVATINQNAWLPSEQLEQAVHELLDVIHINQIRPEIVVPEEPEKIFTQIEWAEVAKTLLKVTASGIITTPAFMAWCAQQTLSTLLKLLPQPGTHTLVKGNCSVCFQEDTDLIVKCCNSTEETPHVVCVTCYTQASDSAYNIHGRCVVCRTGTMEFYPSPPASMWLTVFTWIEKMGRHYVKPLIDYIIRVLNLVPMRVISWVNVLSTMLRALVNPDGAFELIPPVMNLATDMLLRPEIDVFEEAREYPYTAGTTIVRQSGNNIFAGITIAYNDFLYDVENTEVQIDESDSKDEDEDEWAEDESPLQTYEEPVNIFDVVDFREDLWGTYIDEGRGICMHSQLLDQVNTAMYTFNPAQEKSEWQIIIPSTSTVISSVYAYVSDGRCCETCPFGNIENVKLFYQNWVRVHKSRLRNLVLTVYNQVGDPSRIAKNKIPRMIQPTWMTPPNIETLNPSWWEYLTGIYEKYNTLIKVCLGITGAVAALMVANKVWNAWTAPSIAQGDLNYNVSDVRQLRRIATPRHITPQRVTAQSEELNEVVVSNICRNYVLLKCWKGDEVVKVMALIGICGKYAIMPKHYVKALELNPNAKYTLEPAIYQNGTENHLRQVYAYDVQDVREILETDLARIKLPNSYPSFKDIRKFIQTEKDLNGYLQNEGEIILVPTRKRNYIMTKEIGIAGIEQKMKFDDIDDSSFWVTDVLKYNHSEAGACGSMVIVRDHNRPIRAMHVAGTNNGIGYGVLLTQELLENLTDEKIILQHEVPVLETLEDRPDSLIFDNETRVDYLGVLVKGSAPFIPKKSKIIPSLVQKKLDPPITRPAILNQKDSNYTHEKSPLWYGAAKHGKPVTIDFTTTEVKQAKEALWDMLIGSMKPVVCNPKRFTYDEAISGIPKIDFYDPMRLDTSAGYPWQIMDKDTTKRAWCSVIRTIEGDIERVEINTKLKEELVRKENMRKLGIVPVTMFVDTLKDERRKHEKAMKEGGTRVFCASPVDYTIALRQNMLHFCAAFMKKRLDAWHAVGINAKGPEWTELYRRLTRVSGTNIVMMDYSNFGPGFNAVVAEAAAELMIKWTMKNVTGSNETELRSLMMECVNSVHVAGSTVYRQFSGSPSGAAITTIINTLVNLLYLTITWRALAYDKAIKMHPDIYEVMRKHVSVIAYGDDFIMSVSNEFKEIFNTNTIRNFLATHKIAATSAEKELKVMPDFVTIRQASFLKRTFRQHDTRSEMILGPLEEVSLQEIPKWIWQCADKKMATRVNVESALMEAHAHGIQYFQDFKARLNTALMEVGISTVALQWQDLDGMWFTGDMPVIEPLIV